MKKFLPLVFLLISCCTHSEKNNDDILLNIDIKDVNGKIVRLGSLFQSNATVLIFLSPECPICQGYSLTIQDLWQKFKSRDILFAGIIPGNDYSTSAIDSFALIYRIPFQIYFDEKKELTHYLKATVTPQCYIINSKGNILYSGKIDDYAVAPGIKRQRVTQYYLNDALTSIVMNKTVETKETEPAGCFIEP